MYIFTITLVLLYLTCVLIMGMYRTITCLLHRTEKATPAPATPMGGADLDHWNYSPSLGLDWTMFPRLVEVMDTFTSPWEEDEADYLRHGLTQAEADALDAMDDEFYAQQLNDSINTYEAEMDMEWEDEIMGYTLTDIVTFMVLDSEDDPYEDLPFTASMRRSAKVGKSGINYVLNSSAERSIHNAGDKVRK